MSSPLVRRLRLAAALRDLRRHTGLTSEQFAKQAGLTRLDISRLETAARKPDTNKVMACLEAAGIAEDSEEWRIIVRVARDANRKGWWDDPEWAALGERQKRYADVEFGARWIGLYHNCLVPGPLQTPDYVHARDEAFAGEGVEIDPVQGRARLRRQTEIIRDGGPSIDVLLEEQVVRRLAVETATMADQLRHLLDLTHQYPQITIRVVPVECSFAPGHVPRSPMALHTFDDPDDGTALLIETVDDDLLFCDPAEVAPYVRLFDRTREVALTEAASATFLEQNAAKLAAPRKGK